MPLVGRQFVVDGQPYRIRGIHYGPWRPGTGGRRLPAAWRRLCHRSYFKVPRSAVTLPVRGSRSHGGGPATGEQQPTRGSDRRGSKGAAAPRDDGQMRERDDCEQSAFKWASVCEHQQADGEQQRVAIARALANDPVLLTADEPTGNLDSKSAEMVFHLFENMAGAGKTILMVTHDNELAARAQRTIKLADGQIVDEFTNR